MSGLDKIVSWYETQKWTPWPFQTEAWDSYLAGESGLISVPTGAGKTYSAFFGPLIDCLDRPGQGLKILYLTPLKSLSRDIEKALLRPIEELGLSLTVESRTADTSSARKQKQKKTPPDVLLTTPESLAVLLSSNDRETLFRSLRCVILDEWHELLGSKRGVLTECSLSHLRTIQPKLQTWALSATLANLEEAAQVAVGTDGPPKIIQTELSRPVDIKSLHPDSVEEIAWVGRFGLRHAERLAETLNPEVSTLIFTNTRAQAEGWFEALKSCRPKWSKLFGLHHGSMELKERHRVEEGAKEGSLPFVVCTSSLDLGIDFAKVERVVQVGSPKSLARLIQRAGRASHRPMSPCRIDLIPTHAWEVIEIEAVKKAMEKGQIESRRPLKLCYDVLTQHLTTLAVGGGFDKQSTYGALKKTAAYAELTMEAYEEVLSHLTTGGRSLKAYPDYHKLKEQNGLYTLRNPRQAAFHRMQIGVIQSDPQVQVKSLQGKRLGTVEERFIAKLPPGTPFLLGGKAYKVVLTDNLEVRVRRTQAKNPVMPVWVGSALPFSPSVAKAVREEFSSDRLGEFEKEILKAQETVSDIPKADEFMIETAKTKEGWHTFFYPFEGKAVHDALAALIAYRLSQLTPSTLTTSATDYGFEILGSIKIDWTEALVQKLFSIDSLKSDLEESINLSAFAKTRFRDIAKISGLVFTGYPGKKKSIRQVTMTSSLIFDVFAHHEESHFLYRQAFRELFEQEFDLPRMKTLLARLSSQKIKVVPLKKLSPLSLPIFAETMSARVSTETLKERIERIQKGWR